MDAPAPGFRDAGNNGQSGNLMNVGLGGYSWSSTVSGTSGMNLNCDVAWLSPSSAYYRAHGLQLRCLSE